MGMGKLTKNLLLQYASHSDKEIQKAYRLRFCEELLKKGLVSIDDIPLGFARGIDPSEFFILLTDSALTYDETSAIWENYFEIVSKTNVAQIFVAYGIIKLCNSRVNSSVKERGYQWLRELPEINWEGLLLECLLDDESFNHKLAKIGLDRIKKTPESLNMEYMVEYIPSYPVRFRLIKILSAKKQQNVSAFLLSYCLKNLIPQLSASENGEGAKYLPQALNVLPLIINCMTSSEGITEENCNLLSNLYVADKIDMDTYLKISAKLAKLADKENNIYVQFLSDGLVKAAKQSPEALAQVERIMKKALAVIESNGPIRKILYSLSLIAWNYNSREDFEIKILPPLKKLVLSKIYAVQSGSGSFYHNFYLHWIKMDKEVFLEVAAQVPEDQVCELMRFIAAEQPQLWDKFLAKIKNKEQIIPTIICSLIEVCKDENCAAVREKAGCKIKDFLNNFKFSEPICKIISENLQTVDDLKYLQVRSIKLSAREVADILSLLNE